MTTASNRGCSSSARAKREGQRRVFASAQHRKKSSRSDGEDCRPLIYGKAVNSHRLEVEDTRPAQLRCPKAVAQGGLGDDTLRLRHGGIRSSHQVLRKAEEKEVVRGGLNGAVGVKVPIRKSQRPPVKWARVGIRPQTQGLEAELDVRRHEGRIPNGANP